MDEKSLDELFETNPEQALCESLKMLQARVKSAGYHVPYQEVLGIRRTNSNYAVEKEPLKP